MEDWKNKKPEYMDVAFFTERSIEDEIGIMSNMERWTIVVSNLVMFGYVALSLGRVRSLKRFFVSISPLR